MSEATVAMIVTAIIAVLKGIFGADKPRTITETIASGEAVGPVIAAQLRALSDIP